MGDIVIKSAKGNTAITHADGSITLIRKDGQAFNFKINKNTLSGTTKNENGIPIETKIDQGPDAIIISIQEGNKSGTMTINPDGTYIIDYTIGGQIHQYQRGKISSGQLNIPYGKPLDENTNWQNAVTFIPRDPLAIDLTGDGIQTVAVNTTAPLLFDHNGDGAKSATGWLDGSDAWLVRDFGNDGIIASGLELFGVDTDITVNNVTRKATNGFEALAALNTNGDTVFNAADGDIFNQLRLWQDLNQNGVSDAGELSTLADKGITSIALNFTSTNTNLGNGNTVTGKAVVTRTTGTSEIDSVSVAADSAAYNLNLADNPFYSQLPAVPLTSTATALPEMHGSGSVHGLREAMSLGTTQATTLTNTVSQFAAAATRDAQMALLDQLVQQWGATSSLTTSSPFVPGAPDEFTLVNPNDPMGQKIQTFARANPALYHKVIALEQFNGQTGLTQLISRWGTTLPSGVTSSLESAYAALRESTYNALAVQTRLKPYFDAITLVADEQGIRFDTTGLDSLLESRKAVDAKNALIDLVELNKFSSSTLQFTGMDGLNKLRGWVDALAVASPLRVMLKSLSVLTGDAYLGTDSEDIYLGDASANTFHAGEGNDLLAGGAGDDILRGHGGDDILDGNSGNDYLEGDTGADIYLFGKGSGQDTINNYDGEAFDTNADTILLGTGITETDITLIRQSNDLIISLNGSNDALRIKYYFGNDGTSSYVVENLLFADGTVWDVAAIKAKFLLSTSGNDTLIGYATNDSINGADGNDEVYGAAGDDTLDGGTGGDYVRGNEGNDSIRGGTGYDTLLGGDDNDNLQGNENNDTLYGEAGNDTLDGGSGYDDLFGGTGADVYMFGKGSDNDTINNYDGEALGINADTILLGAGITATDITLTRQSNDLIVSLKGSSDRLTVLSYLENDGTSIYAVENLRFADGTAWDVAAVKAKLLESTAGNDRILGYAANDTIAAREGYDIVYGLEGSDSLSGGADSDQLYGGSGNDTLDGETGDDTLDGGAGDDVYWFGLGDGNDVLREGTASGPADSGGTDTMRIRSSVLPSSVKISRDRTDIVLTLPGRVENQTYITDSIRLQNILDFDGANTYGIENVVFDNGTVWSIGDIKSRLLGGSEEDDLIQGYTTPDELHGNGGNDTLIGNDGADNLYGDAGKDHLHGGKGDDYLDGGADDDTLSGGSGNNLYRLKIGGGNDTVERDQLDSLSTTDTVLVPKSVGLENVEFFREGLDIIFRIKGTQDSIRFKDALVNDGLSANYTFMYGVEGGATVDLSAIKASFLQGGAGNDTIMGYATNDNLTGGMGDDVLNANAGNDTLEGGTGRDTLDGGQGNDTYLFGTGDGQDTILRNTASSEINTLKFKAGIAPGDVKIVRADADLIVTIEKTNDRVTVHQFFANDNPGRGYNTIQQIAFTDSATTWDIPAISAKALAGTDANNSIKGTLNADVINGQGGDDVLFGQAGNDTYRFGKGDGQDTLVRTSGLASGEINTLEFKSGLAPKDIAVSRSGNDLILSIIGTQDQVTASQFFGDDYAATARSPLQQVTFADAGYTPWSLADITAKALTGGDKNDWLTGTAGANMISGQGDADRLSGLDGHDTLDGGTGDDRLSGGLGNDTYRFGLGDGQDTIMADGEVISGKLNTLEFKTGLAAKDITFARVDNDLVLSIVNTADKITVSQFFASDDTGNANNPIQQITFKGGDATLNLAAIVNKVLAGSTGADTITGTLNADAVKGQAGDDELYGRAGNDTLDGGTGKDLLSGGVGNDTYQFGKGDGQDVIAPDYDPVVGKSNTLQFKTGVAAGDVKARRVGNDLILSIANTADQVTVLQFFNGDDPKNDKSPIQQITFVDSPSTPWDLTAITNKVFEGSTAPDYVIGTINADAINGSSGIDLLYGQNGNDTLDGGADNDFLSGGTGNDVYKFGKGDGVDTILIDSEVVAGKLNTLTFKAGVLPGEVQARRNGNNLELSITGTADKVIVSQFFNGDDPSNANNPIQQVNFTSSTETWNLATITDKALAGTPVADKIIGTLNADSLTGGDGADVLYGRAGNDMIEGGAGNDQLSGGLGNDTYKFGKGDGQDVIGSDIDPSAGKLNTLQFKAGVADTQVSASRKGYDLILSIANTSDQVTVSNFFYNDDPANSFNPIQQVQFDGGPTWDLVKLKSLVTSTAPSYTLIGTAGADLNLNGTASADTIYGLAGGDTLRGGGGSDYLDGGADNDGLYGSDGGTDNDTLIGGTGDDTLNGRAGDDTLDGGPGKDTLEGGTGNNTFLFGFGSETDSVLINKSHLVNTLQFKAGITEQDVTVRQAGVNAIFTLANSPNDQFYAWGFFTDNDPFGTSNPVNQVRFNDGTVWTSQDVINRALRDGQGITTGTIYNDTLEGGLGSDSLIGGLGNNTYVYNRGDGQDIIAESADTSPSKLNTLYFKGDIAPSDISAKRNGANLELRVAGSQWPITVNSFFLNDNPANIKNPIQQIRFENGTVLDLASIVALLPSGISGPVMGTPGDDAIVGTAMADTILGLAGADRLTGGGGGDRLEGGADNDGLYGGDGTADNDTLLGGSGNDDLNGRGGNDILDGGSGNDTLQGDLGSNTFIFGFGSDADFAFAKPGSLSNTLQFKADVTADDVIVTQSGDDAIFSLIGSPFDKFYAWKFFTNNDPLSSGSISLVRFDDGTTWSVQDVVNKALQGSAAATQLTGTTQGDIITGNGGNDTINGGSGNNTYVFGKGDGQDTILAFDDATTGKLNTLLFKDDVKPSDVIGATYGTDDLVINIEGTTDSVTIKSFFLNNDPANAKNPLQRIQFANGVTWDLATVAALGKSYVQSYGSSQPDRVSRFDGNDVIYGIGGIDQLFGGSDADAIYGGDDNDWLYGESGADFLDGGTGNDVMVGGADDDTYVVDSTADRVIEFANGAEYGGVDNILSNVSYSLPGNVEVLQLTGNEALDATGNDYGNQLFGNTGNNHLFGFDGADLLSGDDGNDSLDGGIGIDTMQGGAGNDIYYVNDQQDQVVEYLDGGRDTVFTSVNYLAPAYIEEVDATGKGNINLTGYAEGATRLIGNAGDNVLTGGTGNDYFNSATGHDILIGGAGDDMYIVKDANIKIIEMANSSGGSFDKAYVYVDNYVVPDYVNKVTLIGSAAINCYGSNQSETIQGNGLNNILNGAGGADILIGGGGNDTLRGGASLDVLRGSEGDDTYIIGASDGKDMIIDTDVTGHDTLLLEGVSESQVWLTLGSTGTLMVSIIGTSAGASISSWAVGQDHVVDDIKAGATGKVLSASKVGALVQAMSTLSPPASGQTTLPQAYQDKLNSVIAASWV